MRRAETFCQHTIRSDALVVVPDARLDARFRGPEGGPQTLHTLNGTAVTSSRTVIAVLEQHQLEDGSVAVPQALLPYGAPAVINPRS